MSDLAVQKNALPAMQMDEAELMNVLRYDASTGLVSWAVSRGRAKAGSVAGTVTHDGRIQISVCGKLYYAHRIAWLLTHRKWPDEYIDHIDGDPLNNRLTNLRDVSHTTNSENQRGAHSDNKTSGLLGVNFDKQSGRWMARIHIEKKTKNLGRFSDPNEAHAAYVAAKRQFHKGGTL